MKWYDIQHRSVDWFNARAGLATTSNFDKIITKGGAESAQGDAYANLLIAELVLGRAVERNFSTYSLEWGEQHEEEALALYRFETGLDVKHGGFFTNDALTLGTSPDQRVFDGDKLVGLAEIKCPENPAIHIEFLLMQQMNPKYIPQVQGQMLISGVEWVDWFSYYPEMPSARIRVKRDEVFISKLSGALMQFELLRLGKIDRLIELGNLDERPVKRLPEHIMHGYQPQAAQRPTEIHY